MSGEYAARGGLCRFIWAPINPQQQVLRSPVKIFVLLMARSPAKIERVEGDRRSADMIMGVHTSVH